MADCPDWLDELDELDDGEFLERLLERSTLVDDLTEISFECWAAKVQPRLDRRQAASEREGKPAPDLLAVRDDAGQLFLLEVPWDRRRTISKLLRAVDSDLSKLTDELCEAHGVTRAEVVERQVNLAEYLRWLREERQRQLGE
jgi:hypothetical protein